MFQQITIVGYLGRDPEMRYTQDGTPVTNFSVAVSRRWKSPDGDPKEETVWFRVAAWNRLAETCNEYLAKGRPVLVIGRLKSPHVWTGQDGIPKASLEITAVRVVFLPSKRGNAATSGAAESSSPTPATGPAQEEEPQEEIPF